MDCNFFFYLFTARVNLFPMKKGGNQQDSAPVFVHIVHGINWRFSFNRCSLASRLLQLVPFPFGATLRWKRGFYLWISSERGSIWELPEKLESYKNPILRVGKHRSDEGVKHGLKNSHGWREGVWGRTWRCCAGNNSIWNEIKALSSSIWWNFRDRAALVIWQGYSEVGLVWGRTVSDEWWSVTG